MYVCVVVCVVVCVCMDVCVVVCVVVCVCWCSCVCMYTWLVPVEYGIGASMLLSSSYVSMC